MRPTVSRFLVLVLLAAIALPAAARAQATGGGGDRTYELPLTHGTVGPEAEQLASRVHPGFIESINARPGWQVPLHAERPADADEAPAGASHWLHLAVVAAGPQMDLLLLEVRNPGLRVVSAQHRPAAMAPSNVRRDRPQPGPGQLPENAVKELAADLGNHIASRHAQAGRAGNGASQPRTLAVRTTGWSGPTAGIAALGSDTPPVAAEPGSRPLQEAVWLLAIAAASQAGVEPTLATTGDSDAILTIGVSKLPQAYALKLTFDNDGRSFERISPNVSREQLYPMLQAMVRHALYWQDAVHDVAALETKPAALLASDGRRLQLDLGGTAIAIAPPSERPLFTTAESREPPQFHVLRNSAGETATVLVTSQLAELDPASGALRAIDLAPRAWADVALASPGRFMGIDEDEALVAADREQKLWEAALPAPAVGAPAADRQNVYAITHNRLLAYRLADGQPLWEAPLPAPGAGPVSVVGSRIIVGCEGGLVAGFDTSGEQQWTWDGGDVLLSPPAALDDSGSRILLTTKNNTVTVLDTQSGEAVAAWRGPDWLTQALVAEGKSGLHVVTADIAGVVRLHRVDDLAPVREIETERELRGPLIQADMPTRWYSEGLEKTTRAVLALDGHGLIYIIALP